MNIRTVGWTILLALCLVLSTATIGAGAVTQPADGTVRFADAATVEEQGDIATIQLELANTDEAELLIRSAQQDYAADLRVHDGDSDGTVTVQFNTFTGVERSDRSTFRADSSDDSVTVTNQSTTQSLPVLDTGRYNLIASTESSRIAATLYLDDGSVGDSRSLAVASNANSIPDTEGESESLTDSDGARPSTTVAQGDRGHVEFDISGLEGQLQNPRPTDRLVFADDSRPGAETTHLLQLSPDRDVTAVRTVSVNYDGGTAPNIQGLFQSDMKAFGIDTTGDGRIDRSLADDVSNFRTESDGDIQIRLDDHISVAESETLLMKYPATNPSTTGTADVRVSLGSDSYVETGTISYGTTELGTLGHGVDLRIETADGQAATTTPLGGAETAYDSTSNTLSVDVDTAHLEPGDYDVTLRVDEQTPHEYDAVTVRERLSVVSPSTTVSSIELTDESTVMIDASTNLAPGNQLVIELYSEADGNHGGFLARYTTNVEEDGTASSELDLPETLRNSTATVAVSHNGTELAGPVEYDIASEKRTE